MNWLGFSLIVLLVVAIAARRLAKRLASESGLPAGKLIYSDTGIAVGKLAPLRVGEHGEKLERPLISKRYGVIGKPDYLIETDDGIIPVEAKSARLPMSGRPYDSHVMQLVAYCLLVEEALGAPAPYGILRYRDGEVQVDYTPGLRAELLGLIEAVGAARSAGEVHRSHDEHGRCANCWMREVCDESLV